MADSLITSFKHISYKKKSKSKIIKDDEIDSDIDVKAKKNKNKIIKDDDIDAKEKKKRNDEITKIINSIGGKNQKEEKKGRIRIV